MARDLANQKRLEESLRAKIKNLRGELEEVEKEKGFKEEEVEVIRNVDKNRGLRIKVEKRISSYYKDELSTAHTLLGRILHQYSEDRPAVNLQENFPTSNPLFPRKLRLRFLKEEEGFSAGNAEDLGSGKGEPT